MNKGKKKDPPVVSKRWVGGPDDMGRKTFRRDKGKEPADSGKALGRLTVGLPLLHLPMAPTSRHGPKGVLLAPIPKKRSKEEGPELSSVPAFPIGIRLWLLYRAPNRLLAFWALSASCS